MGFKNPSSAFLLFSKIVTGKKVIFTTQKKLKKFPQILDRSPSPKIAMVENFIKFYFYRNYF